MKSIAFIDTEIDPRSQKILDIGSIKGDGSSFHKNALSEFIHFLNGTQFICGHNILNHDVKFIGKALALSGVNSSNIIDTLFLSPLLFPTKPYHSLLKDDKLQSEDRNNPLNDSIKAKDLFYDEIAAFKQMDEELKQVLYLLLNDKMEFQAFFRFIEYTTENNDLEQLIRKKFENEICNQVDLAKIIKEHPIELAYCSALINSFIYYKKIHSITPPWVLKNYSEVERIMFQLRNRPCISGCGYCNQTLDVHRGLKRFFGLMPTELSERSHCKRKRLKQP